MRTVALFRTTITPRRGRNVRKEEDKKTKGRMRMRIAFAPLKQRRDVVYLVETLTRKNPGQRRMRKFRGVLGRGILSRETWDKLGRGQIRGKKRGIRGGFRSTKRMNDRRKRGGRTRRIKHRERKGEGKIGLSYLRVISGPVLTKGCTCSKSIKHEDWVGEPSSKPKRKHRTWLPREKDSRSIL